MISLKQIIDTYRARGFKVQHILAYGKFESTRKHIEAMGIMLNVTGCDEHVPEIEQRAVIPSPSGKVLISMLENPTRHPDCCGFYVPQYRHPM